MKRVVDTFPEYCCVQYQSSFSFKIEHIFSFKKVDGFCHLSNLQQFVFGTSFSFKKVVGYGHLPSFC
jgi:hypothetical protein